MLYYKHVKKLSMRLRSLDGEAQSFAQARLTNVRTVRAFANERREAERFQQVRLIGFCPRLPRKGIGALLFPIVQYPCWYDFFSGACLNGVEGNVGQFSFPVCLMWVSVKVDTCVYAVACLPFCLFYLT